MYKQRFRVLPLVLALLLLFALTATVSAQDPDDGPVSISAVTPPSQTSFALIQNLTGTQANVTVQFWGETPKVAGQPDHTDATIKVPANGSANVSPGSYTQLAAGWRGAMVVQSDQQIVATVVNAGGTTAHSIYEGFDSNKASSIALLPSVHWNAAGQETLIAIQNIQSADIQVKVTYFAPNGTPLKVLDNLTVPANSSIFRNAIAASDCGACTGVEGSARIETKVGTDKVAVVATEFLASAVYAYDAIASTEGGTEFLLPSIHHNTAGQFSFILIQETSGNAGTVEITYRDSAGNVTDTKSQAIAANGQINFNTFPGSTHEPTNTPNEGSAKLKATGGAQIIATVIETTPAGPYSYNGFRTVPNSVAKAGLRFPSVHRNLGGSSPSSSSPMRARQMQRPVILSLPVRGQTHSTMCRFRPRAPRISSPFLDKLLKTPQTWGMKGQL